MMPYAILWLTLFLGLLGWFLFDFWDWNAVPIDGWSLQMLLLFAGAAATGLTLAVYLLALVVAALGLQ